MNVRLNSLIQSIDEVHFMEQAIIYSWPLCFIEYCDTVYVQPLFHTIHIVYHHHLKTFSLYKGNDKGHFASDHIEHVYEDLGCKFVTFEEALIEGNKHFLDVQKESEKSIDEAA